MLSDVSGKEITLSTYFQFCQQLGLGYCAVSIAILTEKLTQAILVVSSVTKTQTPDT